MRCHRVNIILLDIIIQMRSRASSAVGCIILYGGVKHAVRKIAEKTFPIVVRRNRGLVALRGFYAHGHLLAGIPLLQEVNQT